MSLVNETINSILIPFNMIADTDMGLLKLIKQKYMDPEVFIEDLLGCQDIILRSYIRDSASDNPLVTFIENEEEASDYYDQFMENKYDEIATLSPITTIKEVIDRFIESKSIQVSILCMEEIEVDIISKLFDDKVNIIYEPILTDIDLTIYDTLFVRDYKFVLMYNIDQIEGKNIYIANMMRNVTITPDGKIIPSIDVSTIIADTSIVHIIDLYDDYITFEG